MGFVFFGLFEDTSVVNFSKKGHYFYINLSSSRMQIRRGIEGLRIPMITKKIEPS